MENYLLEDYPNKQKNNNDINSHNSSSFTFFNNPNLTRNSENNDDLNNKFREDKLISDSNLNIDTNSKYLNFPNNADYNASSKANNDLINNQAFSSIPKKYNHLDLERANITSPKFSFYNQKKNNPNLNNNEYQTYDSDSSHILNKSVFEKKYKFQKHKIYVLDNIIENLSFTKYHLAIILICVFNMLIDGYLGFVLGKISLLSNKFYKWTDSDNTNFTIVQQLCLGLGALISTNTRSIHWDVSSNMLVTIVGTLALFFLNFFTDSISFCVLISIFSVCHGFIANICTNYLIELTNMKYRNYFYNLAYSFKIFGMFFGILVFYGFSYNIPIDNPNFYTIGLPIGEFILSILLIFNIDSLRVLFYSDEIGLLFQYLVEMNFLDEFTGIKYLDTDLQKRNYILCLENKYNINVEILEKAYYNCLANYENLNYKTGDSRSDNVKGDLRMSQFRGKSSVDSARKNLLKYSKNDNSGFEAEAAKEGDQGFQKNNINDVISEFDNNIYFNPIFTDDFLFKKAILKKFDEIKARVESRYGHQENHGVFNSFVVVFNKRHYVTTLQSILMIGLSNFVLNSMHDAYADFNIKKAQIPQEQSYIDRKLLDLNTYNLNNFNLIFYYLALFLSFNILSLLQHTVINYFINYNSIFSYDSIKNLDRSSEDCNCCGNNYDPDNECYDDHNLNLNIEELIRINNLPLDNYNKAENLYLFEAYFKSLKNSIKKKVKYELHIASKIERAIHITCLVIVLITITSFLIIEKENIYIMFFFDLFMMYYCCLIYFHFSQKTTTLLRNCSTSIMYLTICFLSITHTIFNLNLSSMIKLIISLVLVFALIILHWIIVDEKISFQGLQKIEFSIMKKKRNTQ